MDSFTIILDTTYRMFASWLERHTLSIETRRFPTEHGFISLQRARLVRPLNGGIFVEMLGFYCVPDTNGSDNKLHNSGPVIRVEILPLSRERIEVTAKCTQPVVRPYLVELLVEIGQRWREARAIVEELCADADTKTVAFGLQGASSNSDGAALEAGSSLSQGPVEVNMRSVKIEHASSTPISGSGESKRQTRRANADTIDKIKEIANYRQNEINNFGRVPARGETCLTWYSDPRTLKVHAPTLFAKWYDRSYTWKIEDDALKEDREY